MSIVTNKERIGSFTSSEIFKLLSVSRDKKSFGEPAMTYIKRKNQERKLSRSITNDTNAKPLAWGHLLESKVFDLLGLEYSLTSDKTLVHPETAYWSGSPDGTKKDTVIDIKAPITLESFCDLVDPLYNGLEGIDAMKAIRDNHKDGEKYYQQLVSNAILTNSKYAELIVYVPYQSELSDVKMLAQNSDNPEKYYWLSFAGEDELPYLVDGGYYKNLNVIRFDVPQSDKDFLTEKVKEAGKMLIPRSPAVLHKAYIPNDKIILVTD